MAYRRLRKFIHDRSFWIRQLALPAIWVLLHLYAGRPLVTAAAAFGVPRLVTWIGIAVVALSSIVATRVPRRESFRLRKLTHAAGYFSMSLFSILFVLVLGSDLLRYLNLNRQILDVSIAGVGIALAVVGLIQARYPAIRRVRVPIESLPSDLQGFRIVQLSDVHIGPTIQREFVRGVVKRVNALDADAVVITGDLVDGYLHDLRDESAPLRDLDAREGVFYVTGNHEYYWRASEWMPHLTRLGLRLLKNEHEVIRRAMLRSRLRE